MKTLVLEPMPELFWQKIDENGWQDFFVTENSSDIEILIIRTKTKVDRTFLMGYPNLKAIIRAGTGFDNIDTYETEKRNVIVCNTPEANALSAAEHTISFVFALIKQHQIAKECVLNKSWKETIDSSWELSDLKVLIVGVGRVGTRVAKILQNLGAEVRGVDPYLSTKNWNEKEIKSVSFQDGLHWCNMITFHCPLYKDTEGYFNLKVVDEIRNSIWLINTARGGVVNEEAVICGIENNRILGFAADVFSDEPWSGNTFSSLKNVYLSPHIGAFTSKAKNRLSLETLHVWKEFVFHRKVLNRIDLKFC